MITQIPLAGGPLSLEKVAPSCSASSSYLWGALGVFPTCEDHNFLSGTLVSITCRSAWGQSRFCCWCLGEVCSRCPSPTHFAANVCLGHMLGGVMPQRIRKMNQGCSTGLSYGSGAGWEPEAMSAVMLTSSFSSWPLVSKYLAPPSSPCPQMSSRGGPRVHQPELIPCVCVCMCTCEYY